MCAMRNVIVSTLVSTSIGWGAQAVTAQYFGYFVEGGYREVQLDRSTYDAELLYGKLWQTPIGLSGGLVRTGLLLDVARKSRRVSFVWSGALTYAQLSGDFQFGSAAPPFEDLFYSSNGKWYITQGSRQLDVFHLEGSVGLKLRVTHGLVVRIGGTLGYPVYAIQRTRWTLGLTDENGENYEYRMDETVSGSDVFQSGSRDLFYGSYDAMLEGHAELGYEFKGGLGLFIRGSRSTEQNRRIRTYSNGWVSSNWRTYTIGFGLCFRLVRRAPASNWGGAIPLSPTEIRQRRHEERLGSTVQPSDSGSDPIKSYDASAKEDTQQVGTVAEPDKEPTVADTLSVPTPRTTSDSAAKPAGDGDPSAPGAMPIGLRQINTPPLPGEIRRYTVLHPFSAPDAPDTFRVVTVDGPPAWHYLEIVAASGQRLYKAEIFTLDPLSTEPVPLERGAWEATVLRDMLGPWAFGKPMPRALYEAFLDRERRGLHYSVTNDQVEAILMDPAAVSFSFTPEPGDTRLLAVDRRTGTVVNLAPLPQE